MTAVESIRFIDIGVLGVEREFYHKDLFCLIQQVDPCLASINNLVDNIILSKRYFEILSFSYVTTLCNKGNLCLGYRGCVLIVFSSVIGRLS